MAGSYRHVVEDDGRLSSNETIAGMLENGGDVYEAVEEMYGMIWWLAHHYAVDMGYTSVAAGEGPPHKSVVDLVEQARQGYQYGLKASPGVKK